MDFRLLNSAFLPQAAELWDYCFEKKGDPFYEWYFSEYCLKQNSVIGGFDGDKLACMLHLNPYAITLRGQTLRLPYIVGVATAPEYRAAPYAPAAGNGVYRFACAGSGFCAFNAH